MAGKSKKNSTTAAKKAAAGNTKKTQASPTRNTSTTLRTTSAQSPGVKNGNRKTTLEMRELKDYVLLAWIGMSDDEHANPYAKNLTDLILSDHPQVKHLAINVTGNLVKEGTNDFIETIGKDGSPYKIFVMIKVFDTEQSHTQLKAFGEKIAEAYRRSSKFGIKPKVALKSKTTNPINYYLHDDDTARACGIAYKDAIISGKLWSAQDIVEKWFGDLENPQALEFDIDELNEAGDENGDEDE